EMLMAMLARRRDELAAGGAQRGDLLDRLLDARDPESGRAMDDSEIVDNLITFVAAGHETTAQALGWTLDLLARHPRVMAEVSAEIDAVTRGGCVLPEHLVHLVLTRRVLEEGMRLFPPAPIIGREVQDGFALERLGGLEVEPVATIIVPIWAVHRHRRLWDEPGQFDPDRFLPERVASRHRYTWLPFGVGPRVCIGAGFAMLEGMAILAVLLARLRFVPADPSTPAPRMAITLRPATPLRLRPLLRG
ncbi:cytochrome P450, partial [Endobacter medicaginis]